VWAGVVALTCAARPESAGLPAAATYVLLLFCFIPFKYARSDVHDLEARADGAWQGQIGGRSGFPHHEVSCRPSVLASMALRDRRAPSERSRRPHSSRFTSAHCSPSSRLCCSAGSTTSSTSAGASKCQSHSSRACRCSSSTTPAAAAPASLCLAGRASCASFSAASLILVSVRLAWHTQSRISTPHTSGRTALLRLHLDALHLLGAQHQHPCRHQRR
jgi:hypothetical protein